MVVLDKLSVGIMIKFALDAILSLVPFLHKSVDYKKNLNVGGIIGNNLLLTMCFGSDCWTVKRCLNGTVEFQTHNRIYVIKLVTALP